MANKRSNNEFFTHSKIVNGKYVFSDKEIKEKAEKIGVEVIALEQLKDEKSSVMKDFGSKITQKEEIINQLANHLKSGYEYKNMDHTVYFHKPEEGKKTTVNEVTGEEVVEVMVQDDYNLFNMYVEKDKEENEEAENEEKRDEEIDFKQDSTSYQGIEADVRQNEDETPVDTSGFDELFLDAAKIIVKEQQGSGKLLQRELGIGYKRSVVIMEQLEKAGIVGPSVGSTAREVKIKDVDSLENLFLDPA